MTDALQPFQNFQGCIRSADGKGIEELDCLTCVDKICEDTSMDVRLLLGWNKPA